MSAHNLANVRLSELPKRLKTATNMEVQAFYLELNRSTMEAGTFDADPFRLAARDEHQKREQAGFLAKPWAERMPDTYRN